MGSALAAVHAERWVGGLMVLDVREQARAHAPKIQADPALKDVAIATWRARMINETRSAVVFEALADQLQVAGLDPASVARCRGFADEERLHGVLCGAVVEALGGEARSDLPPDAPVPAHEDVGRLEAALRNLLSICCLSETVAVALIGFERESLPDGELKELMTQIYADECGHASFGWRRLPILLPDDPAMKQRLGDYLAVAFAHLEAHELAHLPAGPGIPGGEALGLCDGNEARALLHSAVHDVIIPGLESHGLPAQAAWDRRHQVQRQLAAEAQVRVAEVHRAALGE